MVFSDRGGVRTPNPQSRNLIFYPIELRSRIPAQAGIFLYFYDSLAFTMLEMVLPSA